jgi:diadenylate cyclase
MDSFLSGIEGIDDLSQILLPTIQLTDILDIVAVAALIYLVLIWIRKTRGWMLFRGIAIVLGAWIAAMILNLNMVELVFNKLFNIGILAIIVIFQPELRRALERLGTSRVFNNLFGYKDNTVNKKTADALTEAMVNMASTKTGALIAVEQKVALGEYEQTGIPIDAEISSGLLINIFVKNTPLHDGAVIIRQNRVLAATCYLPLSENNDISKDLGTRHRAALGLSEVSDAKVFIVSEETGAMSMAYQGELYRDITKDFIRRQLIGDANQQTQKSGSLVKRIRRHSGKQDGKEANP